MGLVFDSKVVEPELEIILSGEAGVYKVALLFLPFGKALVIVHFRAFVNDEGNEVLLQAFFKENQSAHTAVSVLEGMDGLKAIVKLYYIAEGLFFYGIVPFKECTHFPCHMLGWCGFPVTNLIWNSFVITYLKPLKTAIACSCFQDKMKLLDKVLGDVILRPVNNVIYATEMVCGFKDIVNTHGFIGNAYSVSFKNIAGLIVGQAAALNVI